MARCCCCLPPNGLSPCRERCRKRNPPGHSRPIVTTIPPSETGSSTRGVRAMAAKKYETIKVEKESGITWVIFNRPDKRNAMSPQLHMDMDDVLDDLAID